MEPSTQINFINRVFSTPLVGSSGTVGYGTDFMNIQPNDAQDFFGGLVLKTITPEPLVGNPEPRVCETEFGFINSIGLQNCGLDAFVRDIHPQLANLKPIVIASVAAFTVRDFVKMVGMCSRLDNIDMIEMNLSCPNTDYRGNQFASDEKLFKEVLSACNRVKNNCPLIAKLSPLNNHVVKMAKLAKKSGADALTISNTFNGIRIDVDTRKPMIALGIGGYSGPAIKPIVLALVHQVSQAIDIPIIGVGGVTTGMDVVEYLLAGATLVGIGTANFTSPRGALRIYREFRKYLINHETTAQKLIGQMEKRNLH